jgi:excisionase family DNA binding protein
MTSDSSLAPLTISIADACRMLSLKRSSIYRLLQSQRLTAVKAGRRTLITMASMRAMVEDTHQC